MVDDGWRWCITVSFILISSHSIQEWLVTFSLCLADLIRWSHHLFLGRLVDIVFSARWDWSVRALDDVSRERSFDTVDTHLLSLRAQVDNCSKRHSFCFALLLSGAPVFDMNSQQQRCCQGFALRGSQFACQPGVFITFSLSQCAGLLLLWPKTCWLLCDHLLSSGLSARLSYQLLARNVHAHVHQMALLAFIWPCGHAFRRLIIRLLTMFWLFWAKWLSACINSTWQQF